MIKSAILDEIICGLQPEELPSEYIVYARVVDYDGIERIIKGKEMEEFLTGSGRANVAEARVILDVKRIRIAIIGKVNGFFTDLNSRLADLSS